MKPLAGIYSPLHAMFYQLLIGGLLFSPLFVYADFDMVLNQWQPILALALITTAFGHTMFVKVLDKFSVTTMSIMSTVQHIYGIIMGVIFLSEVPSFRSLIGGAIILLTVLMESIRSLKKAD